MCCPGRATLFCLAHLTHAVGKKAQGTLRSNRRVQLSHRSGRRIARVDKGFFTPRTLCDFESLPFVEGVKIIATHVDLATHFQNRGGVVEF